MSVNILRMLLKIIKFIGIKLPDKRSVAFLGVITFSLITLTSCGYQYESADIVVEYQIPFAQSGSHFNEIELVDTDEYGRELYCYKSGKAYTNVFSDYMGEDYMNAPVLMYIIIQKTDKDFVYCYDDLCYAYVKSFESDNSDIINNLKEINDWGKYIDDKKSIGLSIDLCEDQVRKFLVISAEEETVTTLEQMVGYEIPDYYLDAIFLEDAEPIFVLREVKKWVSQESKNEFGRSYMFYIPSNQLEAKYLELSDNIENWSKEINVFKESLNRQS